MKEPNFIKANIPFNEEGYEHGFGEGCFFIVDDRTKEAYDRDETGGGFVGILDNDSWHYIGLVHGEQLPLEMRGKNRPVVPIDALSKWKLRPEEEVRAEYMQHMAESGGGME